MKAGYKTTEFWLALAPVIVGLLVAVGVVKPEAQGELSGAVSQIVGGIMAALAALGYAQSRGAAKSLGQ